MYFCKLQLRRNIKRLQNINLNFNSCFQISNKKQNKTCNHQKGFSLIEVLVAISIATVLMTAIINMITAANQSQKNLDQKIASINLINEIISILSNKDACLNTIPTGSVFTYDVNKSPTVISNIKNIKNDTSNVKFSTFDDPSNLNKTYQGGVLKISSISLSDYTPSATPSSDTDSKFYSGVAKLKIVFEKTMKSPGSQIFVKEISLAFALNNGGAGDKTLKSCVAIGIGGTLPNSNFYWIPTATDDGIYYDKKVGIGSKTPEADLDINVTDPTYLSTWFGRTTSPADKVFFRVMNPTTGVSMEVRSQGSLQAPYLAFKHRPDYDSLWIRPPTGGNGLTEMSSVRPFLFSADVKNWGFDRVGENMFDFIDAGKGLSASSSQQSFVSINSNITQSGSAGYSGLKLNVIEHSVGSGSKNLMQLQKNGTDMFTFNSDGDLNVLRGISVGGSVTIASRLSVTSDINTSSCFTAGSIVVGGVCSSDQKLKKDVHEFKLGLDVLLNLKPQNYKFNGLAGTPNTNEETVGLIAQEVQLASNELVSSKKVKMHPEDLFNTEIMTVNYSKLIYVVINAIKDINDKFIKLFNHIKSEQIEKFETLKKENLDLKNELNSLKSVICQLHPKEKICLKQ